jgi:para-nitrobenzyl esterase
VGRHGRDAHPSPEDALVQLRSDTAFVCPSRALARAAAAQDPGHVYRFVYAHVYAAPERLRKLGAGHGMDLPFVFHNLSGEHVWSAPEAALGDQVAAAWSRFAASGDPNGPGLPAWPAYDPAKDDYLELDTPPAVKAGARTAQCDVWDELMRARAERRGRR